MGNKDMLELALIGGVLYLGTLYIKPISDVVGGIATGATEINNAVYNNGQYVGALLRENLIIPISNYTGAISNRIVSLPNTTANIVTSIPSNIAELPNDFVNGVNQIPNRIVNMPNTWSSFISGITERLNFWNWNPKVI